MGHKPSEQMPEENKRLLEVINHFSNGNELAFSNEIGVSQPRINRLFNIDKRSGQYPSMSFEIAQATINKFIELNAEWLISGRGKMFKDQNASFELGHLRKLKTDRKKNLQSIPLYSLEATAGIVDLLHDNRQRHIPIDYIVIPNLPKCDGALPITGDSMYPLLKSGDIVLYKEVHDITNIIWGEMYLIAISYNGDDFFFAKYIQKSEKEGWVKLVSQNQHHSPKDFPIESIKALALIKASIRYNTAF